MINLPYGPNAATEYSVRNLFQYDGNKDTERSQPSQASYIIVPPSEVVHQPASTATAAAAATARRPVPREGLVV